MEKVNVLIIGGGASGLQAAISAKTNNPDKSVIVVRKEEKVLVPCGIPYIFGSLHATDKNIMPDKMLTNVGVEIKIAEVIDVDIENHICYLSNKVKLYFEKLIFATGSVPTIPKWLKGGDLENVFTIPKDKFYLDEMYTKLKDLKKIITIGAGFIGVEMSDELNKEGRDVTLIEIESSILNRAFDKEFGDKAEELLRSRGVKVITSKGVKEIIGKGGKVQKVILTTGEELEADAVVLSMGYMPNTTLAKKSGLELNKYGFIKTCEYMRVDDCSNDIFAVGDCAEKRDFLTRKLCTTMLASTACAEARVAGMSLYELSPCKSFSGTIAIYDTAIGKTAFGTAGIIESKAKDENFSVVAGSFTGMDKHPGTLEGMHEQTVKLIVAADCGMILGGEVCGGCSVGELTNSIGFLIQSHTNIKTLLSAQIGTHPLLTGSPAAYPLIKAAEVVAKKLKRQF
ncbi:FAD-dependent oxidoreductase [Ancylomarina sp. 16SWW S1-10-2]|uniref:FAD-dependent oxidoreductase n=1 Tax=Ancylomarina sp. 16SWW S1-10-2 TaxID=2499681 RepID=UPI0012ADEC9D|nr:FAD-dependent oxidoreductase [Ancylomarina sp. 16SWW S1-10-2]MRT94322.1 FAD-binding protein [Ancylomarina sp. 16SWW S1-10-2]